MNKQKFKNSSYDDLRRKNKEIIVDHAFKAYGLVDEQGYDKQNCLSYLLAGGDLKLLIKKLKLGITTIEFLSNSNFDRAYFGSVTPVSLNLEFIAGDICSLLVRIKNDSNTTWQTDETTPLYLSYHWYLESGSPIVPDGERTELVCPVKPGEIQEQKMRILPPSVRGNYQIELTLVMENQFWCEGRGLRISRWPVLVKQPDLLFKKTNWKDFVVSEQRKRSIEEILTSVHTEIAG